MPPKFQNFFIFQGKCLLCLLVWFFTLGDMTSKFKTYSEIKRHWGRRRGAISTSSQLLLSGPSPCTDVHGYTRHTRVRHPCPVPWWGSSQFSGDFKTRPAETSVLPGCSRSVCPERPENPGAVGVPWTCTFPFSVFPLSPFCLS